MSIDSYIVIIFIVCAIIVGLYQNKFKKPTGVRDVQNEEKKKKEQYLYKLKKTKYICGYSEELENKVANLGIKIDGITFFQDVILKNEGWIQPYRREEIIIRFDRIIKVIYQKYETISDSEVKQAFHNEKVKEKHSFLIIKYIDNDGFSKILVFDVGTKLNSKFKEILTRYLIVD